jgi:hypothetical protein
MRGHNPVGWAATLLIAVAYAHVLLELATAVLAVVVAARLLLSPARLTRRRRARVAGTRRPAGGAEREPRLSRRERDLAAFRERRRQTLEEVRTEARRRIAHAGEPASVADALAALEHPEARPWRAQREQLEAAIATGRIVEVGAAARRAMWAISRDAARSSRRARRDPELALALCVAYAVIARLPRTALRSAERARPTPHTRSDRRRAFWR